MYIEFATRTPAFVVFSLCEYLCIVQTVKTFLTEDCGTSTILYL